jgi:Flp pilus assembly protein TadG
MKLVRKFGGDRRGSMTVEFVLLIPILVGALIFGFEFGRALWAHDVLTRDVRAAVRYLSRAAPYGTAEKNQATAVAKTGSPSGTSTHFPWTAGASVVYSETPFYATEYSVDGIVITATATVPVTLSLMSVFDSLSGETITANYTFVVSDQARWIGN